MIMSSNIILMKKIRITLLMLCTITIFSCKKEEPTKTSNEYYVKYIINSSSTNWGNKINVTLTNEKNNNVSFTIDEDTESETIIGPVDENFVARINAITIPLSYQIILNAKIEVSKNSSPFALKAINNSTMPRSTIELNYDIDY